MPESVSVDMTSASMGQDQGSERHLKKKKTNIPILAVRICKKKQGKGHNN